MDYQLSVVNTLPLKDAAKLYVSLWGFAIFPLQPGSKIPYPRSHGVHDATTNLKQIATWWDLAPDSNIGIAAGMASGIDCVDIDEKNPGRSGTLSWLDLGGDFKGLRQCTPNGGHHILLHHENWLSLKGFVDQGAYGGLDFRSSGGYFVGAPSILKNQRYRWADGPIGVSRETLIQIKKISDSVKPKAPELGIPSAEALSSDQVWQCVDLLGAQESNFLRYGLNWKQGPKWSDSEALYRCLITMILHGWSLERIARILPDTYAWDIAKRHTAGDPVRWLWKYSVPKAWNTAQKEIRAVQDTRFEVLPEKKVPSGEEGIGTGELEIGNTSIDHIEIAAQRARSLAPDDADKEKQAQILLTEALSHGPDQADIEKLIRTLHESARISKGFLRGIVKTIKSQALARRGVDEVREIYVRGEGKLIDPINDALISRESALIAWSRAFNGDKGEAEKYYLTGPEAKCEVVEGITYHPGEVSGIHIEDTGLRMYNRYRPSPIQGAPGDVGPWLTILEDLEIGGDEEKNAFLDWCAWTVQNPGEKINHGILLGGYYGIGKDSFIEPIIAAVGDKNTNVARGKDLPKDFDSYLVNAKLLVIQEVQLGSRSDREEISAKLKPCLASPPNVITVDEKYMRPYAIPNLIQVIATTNRRNPIHMETGERRWLCLWCNAEKPRKDSQWFQEYYAWLQAGGNQYVAHWLKRRDLSHYNPKAKPMITDWAMNLQTISRDPLIEWIIDRMTSGTGICRLDVISSKVLLEEAITEQRAGMLQTRGITLSRIKLALEEIGSRRFITKDGRYWVIRNLREAKKRGRDYWLDMLAVAQIETPAIAAAMDPETRKKYRIQGRDNPQVVSINDARKQKEIFPSWY